MPIAVRSTPRTNLELVDALGELGVATVHEAQDRTGLLAPRLRPVFRPALVAGNALTCEVAPGNVGVPIVCAGAAIRPGDVIVADDDGVVVVRRERAGAVLEQARKRVAGEAGKRVELLRTARLLMRGEIYIPASVWTRP